MPSTLNVCTPSLHAALNALHLERVHLPAGFVKYPLLDDGSAVPITITAAVFVHCFKGDKGWMKRLINHQALLLNIIKIQF